MPQTHPRRALVVGATGLVGREIVALFAEDAWAQVSACFERVVSTDAVPHPSNRIELASLLANALLRNLRD